MSFKLLLLAALAGAISAVEEFEDDAPASKPAPKKKPPADDDDEPAPKPKAKPKAKPAEDDDDGMDYEKDVRPHVVGLSKDHGREVALEVLERFTNPATDEPCTKGQEVAPADYEKLLKAIKRKRAELDD